MSRRQLALDMMPGGRRLSGRATRKTVISATG
jgi:hypothetical protein